MHEKNRHQKSIKISLKLPTEKQKILTKDAYNKNWTRKSFFKKATSKRPAKSFWIEKIEKKENGKFFNKNNEERSWNEKY